MPTLLLASASPARRALLTAAGIEPLVTVSGVDEDAALTDAQARFGDLDPADVVLVLARAKALAVASAVSRPHPGTTPTDEAAEDLLVLGCDSMLELGGAVVGKPTDARDAAGRWRAMRGRTGTLHTGHWLVDLRDDVHGGRGGTIGATSATRVHFSDVSDAEIEAYVATGEPLGVAGAFTIDGLGGPFIDGIEGDPHTVVGLSLPLLRRLMGDLGVAITDFWR